MTTTVTIPDETRIDDIVSSQRAVRHLKAAGIHRLADVRRVGVLQVAAVKYVGEGSLLEINAALGLDPVVEDQAASAQEEEGGEHSVEECDRPLRLSSPHKELRVAWLRSNKVVHPDGGFNLQETIWVEFENGIANVTPRMFFMRRYARDEARVRQALEDGEAWRVKCAEDIRRFSRYGIDFFIIED